jgi:hypothetical protein
MKCYSQRAGHLQARSSGREPARYQAVLTIILVILVVFLLFGGGGYLYRGRR